MNNECVTYLSNSPRFVTRLTHFQESLVVASEACSLALTVDHVMTALDAAMITVDVDSTYRCIEPGTADQNLHRDGN